MKLYGKYFDPGTAGLPYGSEAEYWSDLLAVLDMRLAALTEWRAGPDGSDALVGWQSAREMALPPERALAFLKRGRLMAVSSAVPEGTEGEGSAVRKELHLGTAHIMSRLTGTAGMGDHFMLRRLFRLFSLSKLEQFLFLVATAPRMDARYGGLYLNIQGGGRTEPTLSLAFALYELSDPIPEDEKASLEQRRGNLFSFLTDWKGGGEAAFSQTYQVSERLWSFLMGERRLPAVLERIAILKPLRSDPGPVLIREEQTERIRRFTEVYGEAQPGESRVLHLYGEAGNGKHFAVQKGAALAGKAVIFVEVTPLFGKNTDFETLLRRLKLECVLAGAILCFVETGVREEEEETEQGGEIRRFPEDLDRLLRLLCAEVGAFIWMSLERGGYLTRYPLHFLALEFPMLSISERMVLWKAFGKEFPLEEGMDVALFANQYTLTARGDTGIFDPGRHDALRRGGGKNRFRQPEAGGQAAVCQSIRPVRHVDKCGIPLGGSGDR